MTHVSLRQYLDLIDRAQSAATSGDWRAALRLEFQADTVRLALLGRLAEREA